MVNRFADHFQSVYTEAASSVASEQGTCPSIAGKIGLDVGHLVTVELVQSCISKNGSRQGL